MAAASIVAHGMASFTSPCPSASWNSEEFMGKVAYIRALKDNAISREVQQMMIDGTGIQWIVKDIDCGHSVQIANPEELSRMLVELANEFTRL